MNWKHPRRKPPGEEERKSGSGYRPEISPENSPEIFWEAALPGDLRVLVQPWLFRKYTRASLDQVRLATCPTHARRSSSISHSGGSNMMEVRVRSSTKGLRGLRPFRAALGTGSTVGPGASAAGSGSPERPERLPASSISAHGLYRCAGFSRHRNPPTLQRQAPIAHTARPKAAAHPPPPGSRESFSQTPNPSDRVSK